MGLSPEQRLENLQAFARKFNRYLIETPGMVLSGPLRWAVAVCARDALFCKGCATLGQNVCVRNAYESIRDLKHPSDCPIKMTASTTSDCWTKTLQNLVHTIINHQTKVDESWYHHTMEALDNDLGLIHADREEESRRSLLASLYCEIVCVSLLSHSIHIMLLGTVGQEAVIPLPSLDDMKHAPAPLMLDMTTIFRTRCCPRRTLRQTQEMGFAPYFVYSDLDYRRASQILTPFAMNFLKRREAQIVPYAALCMSPMDCAMLAELGSLFNYDIPEVSDGQSGNDKRLVATTSRSCSCISRSLPPPLPVLDVDVVQSRARPDQALFRV